jgi:hypothetical protein
VKYCFWALLSVGHFEYGKFTDRMSEAFPEYVTSLLLPFLKFIILLAAQSVILAEEKRDITH